MDREIARLRLSFTALAIACLLISVSSARGAAILDQSFDAVAQGGMTGASINHFGVSSAQSFEVGTSGILTEVGLQIRRKILPAPNADLIVEIRQLVGGIPGSGTATLANTTIALNQIPIFNFGASSVFVRVHLSSFALIVEPGDVLAIFARASGSGDFVWIQAPNDEYTQGTAFVSGDFGSTFVFPLGSSEFDYGFETSVTPVPVPGSAFLPMLCAAIVLRVSHMRT